MNSLGNLKTIEDLFVLAPNLGISLVPTKCLRIEGNKVTVNTGEGASEQQDLKTALREVKLRTGEARLLKKAIAEFKRQRRVEYTSYVRQRGSTFRGGGWFGRVIRAFTTASRDSKRASLDRDLQPFEHGQAVADAAVRALKAMEIQIKAHIA